MGEKVDGAKNEGEKKPAEKKEDGKATAVFKMEMHCEGCAKKIRRAVRGLDGIEDVKTDCAANKLTVTGKANPAAIKERLEQKTKKKVELVSPQPKKDGGGDKKPEEKSEKKEEKKKEEDKKPKENSVVLMIRLHCEGCIQKIRKIILKFNGVEKVDVDAGKDLVTVKGTMDVKQMVPYLSEKLRRKIEVVQPKKDVGGDKKAKESGGGGDKKDKEGGGGGNKKEKEAGGGDGGKKEEGGGGAKVEVSKMEYHGYPYGAPMHYWQEGQSSTYAQNYPMMDVHQYPQQGYGVVNHPYANQGYVDHHAYANQGYVDHHQGYGVVNHGYMVPPNHPMHAPQMFSDENPNGCSIM